MNMKMLRDPCSGGLSQVDADIKPFGLHDLRESILATAHQPHQIGDLFIDQTIKIHRLLVRHYHEMSACVRIPVQEREASAISRDDEVGFIIARLGDSSKERAFRNRSFRRKDIFDPPGGVQTFHRGNCQNSAFNVKAQNGGGSQML